MVQWLRLCASTAGGTNLIPAPATKILQVMQCGQKKKKKRNFFQLGESEYTVDIR